MALDLRPNCEWCDADLAPDATDAMICSYECTFCAACVSGLDNVCPNCGGGFTPRPIRPRTGWRPGLSLAERPASTTRVRPSYTREEARVLAERLRDVAPELR